MMGVLAFVPISNRREEHLAVSWEPLEVRGYDLLMQASPAPGMPSAPVARQDR